MVLNKETLHALLKKLVSDDLRERKMASRILKKTHLFLTRDNQNKYKSLMKTYCTERVPPVLDTTTFETLKEIIESKF